MAIPTKRSLNTNKATNISSSSLSSVLSMFLLPTLVIFVILVRDNYLSSQEPFQRIGTAFDQSLDSRKIILEGHSLNCLPSYSSQFKNVLLVIQFTVRLGSRREMEIEELYSCFFPSIVRYTHCDPNDSLATEGNMTCIPDPTPGLHPTYSPSWFQYEFMADAMERFPTFDGYIFMQEDVLLNFWNFPIRHDFSKVWRALMFADPDPDVWHQHMNISLNDPKTIPPIAKIFIDSSIQRYSPRIGSSNLLTAFRKKRGKDCSLPIRQKVTPCLKWQTVIFSTFQENSGNCSSPTSSVHDKP